MGGGLLVFMAGTASSGLDDERSVRMLVSDIVSAIGMTAITPVRSVYYRHPINDSLSGVSADVIIAESSVNIHTYPFFSKFYLVVFSCKPFNVACLTATLGKWLGRIEIDKIRQIPV